MSSLVGLTGGFFSWWNPVGPLRDALDWLRDEVITIFEREGKKVLRNPWDARNDFISVILKRGDDSVKRFLKNHALSDTSASNVLRMMEMQRHAMLMYTSCGWFFDEISGIETVQVLQYACRVIQLASQVGGEDLELEFLKRLELAPSNVPQHENGALVYKKLVMPSRTNLQRVGMHFAVASLFEDEPESLTIFNYKTSNELFVRKKSGEQTLVLGITKVKSQVTLSEKRFAFAVIHLGKHNIIGNISLDMEPDKFAGMQFRIVKAFEEGRLGDVIGLMQQYFGQEKYTIWQLFQDEKRKVLDLISHQSMAELEESLRRVYNRDYPLITALSNNEIPIPTAYKTTFEYVLNADLVNMLKSEKISTKELERISFELERWNLKVDDTEKLSILAGETIFRELKKLKNEGENLRRVSRINKLFPIFAKFNLQPNLHQSQNLYFETSLEIKSQKNIEVNIEWADQFSLLGENLGVKVEYK
jgi:hypothetical protein